MDTLTKEIIRKQQEYDGCMAGAMNASGVVWFRNYENNKELKQNEHSIMHDNYLH